MKFAPIAAAGAAGVLLVSSALSHGPARPQRGVQALSVQLTQPTTTPVTNPRNGGVQDPSNGRGGQTGKLGAPKKAVTGTGAVHGQADYRFVPGQDGSIAWNTTRKVGDTPIMLYLFNCEDRKGENFEFARHLEQQILRDKKLAKDARDFTCEKLCHDSPYFLDKVQGREMLHPFVKALKKDKKKKVDTSIVFLDSKGKVISTLNGIKKLKKLGARGLMKEMEKAEKENSRRLAATP